MSRKIAILFFFLAVFGTAHSQVSSGKVYMQETEGTDSVKAIFNYTLAHQEFSNKNFDMAERYLKRALKFSVNSGQTKYEAKSYFLQGLLTKEISNFWVFQLIVGIARSL